MKNKGFTLVELIISISLISVVILFLFQLFVDVRHDDNAVDYDRNNQQTRAVIIKTVQDDFLDNGLVGLNTTGSNNNQLVVNFTYRNNTQGILTVNTNSISYRKANNEMERWILDNENSNEQYNIHCVRYQRIGFDIDGDFFSIKFSIPLEFKSDKKNIIDDMEFSYMGKKSEVKDTDFIGGNFLGYSDQNKC